MLHVSHGIFQGNKLALFSPTACSNRSARNHSYTLKKQNWNGERGTSHGYSMIDDPR